MVAPATAGRLALPNGRPGDGRTTGLLQWSPGRRPGVRADRSQQTRRLLRPALPRGQSAASRNGNRPAPSPRL